MKDRWLRTGSRRKQSAGGSCGRHFCVVGRNKERSEVRLGAMPVFVCAIINYGHLKRTEDDSNEAGTLQVVKLCKTSSGLFQLSMAAITKLFICCCG